VELLCAALNLRRGDFLCTSVPGAKLPGGADTDEVLRSEIYDVPVFLSLLTKSAVRSTYVLFELGARWGSKKHHIPLLAKGAGTEILKDPLKATNALHMSEEHSVLQLVGDVADQLNTRHERPDSYFKYVTDVVKISKRNIELEVLSLGPVQIAEGLAKTRLTECIDILKNIADFGQATNLIRHIQKSWNPEIEQVSVVANDKFVVHLEPRVEGHSAAEYWADELQGNAPQYPGMKHVGKGTKIVRIRETKNRITVIAFEYIEQRSCMVIAEAHHHEKLP
jgi:hypothetical protein